MNSDNDRYRLVRLANGAHSLHSEAHDETFHPVIGPAAEAETLYARQLRLPERVAAHGREFVIWDIGLGAAANALAALEATRGIPGDLRLVSFDRTLEPLRFALAHADALGYFHTYRDLAAELAARGRAAAHEPERTLHWQLHLADFPAWLRETSAPGERAATGAEPALPSALPPAPDAILFDAYSPATNPSMWTLPLFTALFARLDPARPCSLATYSRSTLIRATLLLAGFYVGRGLATGEKEETTVAANAPELIAHPLDARWLARAQRSTSAEPLVEPVYRQAPLSDASARALSAHPQFGANSAATMNPRQDGAPQRQG